MPQPVLHELTHHRYLRERLEAAFPDADEETLMDTLEGMTSLTDSLAELLRSSQEDQSLASALRGRMSDMQARCGRFEERARKKRELVCTVMEEADLKKLPEPDFTVSLALLQPYHHLLPLPAARERSRAIPGSLSHARELTTPAVGSAQRL